MGKVRKVKKKFNHDRNRRKEWKKKRQLPSIPCAPIKQAWNEKKTMRQNFVEMGLCADPNATLPKTKDMMGGSKPKLPKMKKIKKGEVVEALEEEANIPQQRRFRLSDPDVMYCIYMMEKYGDDFKAMARDHRNHYQDTPKQIKRKINQFKSIPEQYNKYIDSKDSSQES